jgi:hypothetical protein
MAALGQAIHVAGTRVNENRRSGAHVPNRPVPAMTTRGRSYVPKAIRYGTRYQLAFASGAKEIARAVLLRFVRTHHGHPAEPGEHSKPGIQASVPSDGDGWKNEPASREGCGVVVNE